MFSIHLIGDTITRWVSTTVRSVTLRGFDRVARTLSTTSSAVTIVTSVTFCEKHIYGKASVNYGIEKHIFDNFVKRSWYLYPKIPQNRKFYLQKVTCENHLDNLPQAVSRSFATLLPPPQSSGQELESPVFGLMVSPGHGRHASRCPPKKALQ